MDNSSKHNSCAHHNCSDGIENIDDPHTIAMWATGAILVAGFLTVAFVSGELGLIATLVALSSLGLYYAIKGS